MISILNQEEKQDVHLVGNSSSSIHMTSAAEVAVTNVILEAVAGSTGDHAVTAATLLSVVAVGAATLPAAVADLLVSAATASTTTTTNDDSNKNKEDTILLVPPIIDKLSKEQEVEETKGMTNIQVIYCLLLGVLIDDFCCRVCYSCLFAAALLLFLQVILFVLARWRRGGNYSRSK